MTRAFASSTAGHASGSPARSPWGSDTSALWQLEGALAGFEQGGLTDQGAHTSIVSRNSFVGVENRHLGRLVAGNNDSAYRRLVGSGGDMGGNLGLTVLGLDLWNNTSAQFSGNGKSIFGRGEERYHNSLHYVSPAFPISLPSASIQVAASYGVDQALVQSARRDRFSVAALYRVAGFALGAAFDRQANTGVDVDNLQQGFGLRTDALNGVATYYYEVLASLSLPVRNLPGCRRRAQQLRLPVAGASDQRLLRQLQSRGHAPDRRDGVGGAALGPGHADGVGGVSVGSQQRVLRLGLGLPVGAILGGREVRIHRSLRRLCLLHRPSRTGRSRTSTWARRFTATTWEPRRPTSRRATGRAAPASARW